jgi:hypothetical protein
MGAAFIPALIPGPIGPIIGPGIGTIFGPIGPGIGPTINMEGIMKESEEKLNGWLNAIINGNDGKSPAKCDKNIRLADDKQLVFKEAD